MVQRSSLSFTGPFFDSPKGTGPINEDPHLYGSAGSLFVDSKKNPTIEFVRGPGAEVGEQGSLKAFGEPPETNK